MRRKSDFLQGKRGPPPPRAPALLVRQRRCNFRRCARRLMSFRDTGRKPAAARKKNKEARNYAKALLARCLALPKRAPDVLERAPKKLRLGSDCAGYGSDRLALALCGLQATVAFTSEADPVKRPMLAAVHKLFGDDGSAAKFKNVCTRKNHSAPECDLLIAGPPCPAFSRAGRRAGLDDRSGQGAIAFYVLDYVAAKFPRVCILENVKGLLDKTHAPVFKMLLDILHALGYETHHRILNTLDHGIPQNRPRVYLVAIRDIKRPFKWPKALPTPHIKEFIDLDVAGHTQVDPVQDLGFFAEKAGGMHKLLKHWYVVDLGASKTFRHLPPRRICPCLTRTRCGSAKSYYIPKLQRFLTVPEMGTLQGLPKQVTSAIVQAAGGRADVAGRAIGDAMSVNVLMRLLPRALHSAGLIDTLPADVLKAGCETSLAVHPDHLLP